MKNRKCFGTIVIISILLISGKEESRKQMNTFPTTEKDSVAFDVIMEKPDSIDVPEGMVWIPGGTFEQGALASDEMPPVFSVATP
jgi:hypothetical protein